MKTEASLHYLAAVMAVNGNPMTSTSCSPFLTVSFSCVGAFCPPGPGWVSSEGNLFYNHQNLLDISKNKQKNSCLKDGVLFININIKDESLCYNTGANSPPPPPPFKNSVSNSSKLCIQLKLLCGQGRAMKPMQN